MHDEEGNRGMELAPDIPAWLIWAVAAGVGVLAIAALGRALEAVFDLDPR